MILSSPWWCVLALLGVLPWIGPWMGLGPNTNLVQRILRSSLFIVLALALTRPHWVVDDTTTHRVLVVDRSMSVSESAIDSMDSLIVELAESSDPSHLVVVGEPLPANDLAGLSRYQSITSIAGDERQGDSPLSAGISRAQSLIPRDGGGSVTIISDGSVTRPDDDRAIVGLLRREIPIHVVEVPENRRPPTPVRAHWSEPLRKGRTSRIRVGIESSQPVSPGTVILRVSGETIASAEYSGAPSETVELEFEPKTAGFLSAEIAVDAEGQGGVLSVVLPIQEPHQLLYFGDLQQGGRDKIASMLGAGFELVTVDLNDVAAVDAALQKVDLVLMDDFSAESFSTETEQAIVGAVQSDGLGLVMSGGRSSFGAGGWHDRPLETLLPVEFVQKEEKRDPSTSLVIVIDTSGSMTGVRVQLAKEVARLAMRRLLPHDKVGIVEFYGAKRWAAPLQPASNAIELQRALNRMDAGGGTVILPALEEAFYGLQNVDTRYKHVIVLTDGGVESGDFESLMRRMANEGINVSTVLAGGGYHSEFLVNIANWGKGRFYNVPNRFNLPEILLKQPSTTKLPSYRPGAHPVHARGGSGWWGDVDTTKIPDLAGYVETKARVGSEVLLETVKEKHPILSTWRYGLGRVTALATEPVGNGTRPWTEWPEYSDALARILQRSAADSRDPFRFTVENDGSEMIIHAQRVQPRGAGSTDALPVAHVWEESVSGGGEKLSFSPRSPDWYTARVPAPPFGECLKIMASSDRTLSRQQPLVVHSPVVGEHHVDPKLAIDLQKLAELSNGRSMTFDSNWSNVSARQPTGKTFWSLAPWLFTLSLVLFLAEIVWRRLPGRQEVTQ